MFSENSSKSHHNATRGIMGTVSLERGNASVFPDRHWRIPLRFEAAWRNFLIAKWPLLSQSVFVRHPPNSVSSTSLLVVRANPTSQRPISWMRTDRRARRSEFQRPAQNLR